MKDKRNGKISIIIKAIIFIIILFIINANGVKADEPKFSCAYETSYIIDFYDDGRVIFYTMAYTYPDFKFDASFNKNRSNCPQEIYVVEDYVYIIAETQIKDSHKFTLTIPQDLNPDNNVEVNFSCKIGNYYIVYYTDGTAKAENYNYTTLGLFKEFNQNPSSCPSDLYEKKINSEAVIISDKPVSGFTLVDKTTDENAANDNPYGSSEVPNNEQPNYAPNQAPNGDSSLVVNPNAVSGMDICSQNGIKQVLHILGILIFIVKLVVPLILIVMGTIDLVSALKDPDDKSMKDQLSRFVKRILIAIIIFLIPTIINFAFSLIDNANNFNTKFSGCTECLFKPFGGNCNYSKIGE